VAVKRVVANMAAARPGAGQAFYGEILGRALVMDEGWLVNIMTHL
jgi:hypothetical protein